jgi:hypothetical protein
MAFRKTELFRSRNLRYPISGGRLVRPQPAGSQILDETKPDSLVAPATLTKVLAHMRADKRFGAKGAAAFREAYVQAKALKGSNPSLREIQQRLKKGETSLKNERAKGRINDNYVDGREAASTKNPVAVAMYAWLDNVAESTVSPQQLRVRATFAQLDTALANLEDVVDTAFAVFNSDAGYQALVVAIADACKSAGIPKDGCSAIIIAANGKTGRGDNGTLETPPTAAEVKQALRSAVQKLKNSDGAAVVDFSHPNRAPKSKADKVVTGVEVDRTPAATGKALWAVLKYASKLRAVTYRGGAQL